MYILILALPLSHHPNSTEELLVVQISTNILKIKQDYQNFNQNLLSTLKYISLLCTQRNISFKVKINYAEKAETCCFGSL